MAHNVSLYDWIINWVRAICTQVMPYTSRVSKEVNRVTTSNMQMVKMLID